MRFVLRALAALLTLVAVNFFVFWMSQGLLFAFAIPGPVFFGGALLVAVAAAAYVWRATASVSGSVGAYVACGALLAGSIGFSLGFFGPLLIAPESNQGPLLGILITGPAGFVLGAFAGGAYWHLRKRERDAGVAKRRV